MSGISLDDEWHMQEVTNEEMQREQNKTRIYKEKYQRISI